jgi:predicted aspartyl protease
MRIIAIVLALSACKTMQPAAVSKWVPFDRNAQAILFDVTIDGVPAKAKLDTGASISLISQSLAEKAGIGKAGHSIIVGAFGSKRLDQAKSFTVAFVGENGPEGAVPVQEAAISDQPLGCDVLLGVQFLWHLVVQIDYPNARFRYMTRNASTIAEQANINARMDIDSGRLLVEVEVDGSRRWAMLDTGAATGLLLKRRTAEEGGWLVHAKPAGTAIGHGVTRSAEIDVMILETLKVGPYELSDIPMTIQNRLDAHRERSRPKLGSHIVPSDDAEPAVLGHDILHHFVLTLDLEKAQVHVYGP